MIYIEIDNCTPSIYVLALPLTSILNNQYRVVILWMKKWRSSRSLKLYTNKIMGVLSKSWGLFCSTTFPVAGKIRNSKRSSGLTSAHFSSSPPPVLRCLSQTDNYWPNCWAESTKQTPSADRLSIVHYLYTVKILFTRCLGGGFQEKKWVSIVSRENRAKRHSHFIKWTFLSFNFKVLNLCSL